LIPSLLALGASLTWGVSDFTAGVYSRRYPVLSILLLSQIASLVFAVLLVLAFQVPAPSTELLVAAALSGVSVTVAIAAMLRGFAVAHVGVVSPLVACGGVIPVAFGLIRGEAVSSWQMVGMVAALAGIIVVAAARPNATAEAWKLGPGVGWGLLSACGIGGFHIFLSRASGGEPVWALLMLRTASVVLLVGTALFNRPSFAGMTRKVVVIIPVTGIMAAGASLMLSYAYSFGVVSLTAVLAVLGPVVVVILGGVVLRERFTRGQAVGVVLALIGVVLLALR
jgi:drug/metabolite transporter (DMT)-like permease